MSVSSFVTGDKFVIRIVKHLQTNPDRKWANSYEFEANIAGSEDELLNVGTDYVNFEKAIHATAVTFDRLLISTWEADSVPYDPTAFISIPISGNGLKVTAADLEPLNMCLSVARVPQFGRFGHLFYRGFLQEVEVVSPAGKPTLVNRAAVQTDIDTAVDSSSISETFAPGGSGPLVLSMINKDGTQVRNVVGFSVQGVSSLPLDHAWFNRTPPSS